MPCILMEPGGGDLSRCRMEGPVGPRCKCVTVGSRGQLCMGINWKVLLGPLGEGVMGNYYYQELWKVKLRKGHILRGHYYLVAQSCLTLLGPHGL